MDVSRRGAAPRMHSPSGMKTRRLEEGTRLFGSISWGPIITGVFLALALQTLLMLFGLAIVQSTGDNVPGNGFAVWVVIVQLAAIAFGAAVASSLSRGDRRAGIAAGIMVWAVGLVLSGFVTGLALGAPLAGSGAWSAFFGALLGLAAAIIGGMFGSRIGRARGSLTGATTADVTDYSAQPAR